MFGHCSIQSVDLIVPVPKASPAFTILFGATLSEAESAQDSQKLTDRWGSTHVYACVVQLGAFDQIKFQQLQDASTM